jgi:hypothetical protein
MYEHHYHQLHSASHVSFVNTAWWQVILALIVAFSTALSAHYFYERRKQRSTILSAGAQLIAAARQLRRNYLGFAEYETEFNRQQMAYFRAARTNDPNSNTGVPVGSLDNERQADLARAAADTATAQSKIYQKEILLTHNEIDKSYFLLLGLSSKAREDEKLKKALEALLNFRLITIAADMKQARQDIEKVFTTNLAIIQERCGQLMEDSSRRL